MDIYLYAKLRHDHLMDQRVSNVRGPKDGEVEVAVLYDQPDDYFARARSSPGASKFFLDERDLKTVRAPS